MERIPIGQFIRERRLAKGMTQEELCHDICSVPNLSKIEAGIRLPGSIVLHGLLERLGEPDTYYTVPMDKYENKISPLRKEARALVVAFGKAMGEERVAIRENALTTLRELEELTAEDDYTTRQRILSDRVVLGTDKGPYPPEQRRELLLKALKLTVPKFDMTQINNFWYTQEETELINQIAVAYVMEGERKAAINIYRQLLYYIQKNNQQLSRYAGQLTMVTYNLARELTVNQCFEEATAIAEIGRKVCVKYDNHQLHPQFLAILANCHAHLGHKEVSTEFYWQAYYLYKAFEDFGNLEHLKEDAQDTLGLVLP